ncbi:MAG TPA: hypothetical protein ENH82_03030 [bacterium]|nr:hypothetical protein [bacterium]
MKKNIQKILIIGISIIFSIAFVTATLIDKKLSTETVTTLSTFFLVIVVIYFIHIIQRRKNIVANDEYTIYQNLKSFRNSWIVALVAIVIIFNLDSFGIYSFQMNTALGIILIVMVFSFWISYFIYLKRPNAK